YQAQLLLSASEHRQLQAWNETSAPILPATIVDLFEQQAARAPDRMAVVDRGARVSYAGLNRRANRLTHHLRRHGIGCEVPVGICLERSADLIVAVLGVLKAGGTYVPLDP